ncbi:hypothetical protein HUG17_6866 [Dermatophagoides farinae]|uniref:Serine aminopeptidase S33 domain-containing protein n=1 Tax=Dermatophagoides farinae TaxID=6954 RepID=A0A9D4NMV6_DERFA|nr:hypothetical protein HUG17_6866 [Dermatophagoides farinae]
MRPLKLWSIYQFICRYDYIYNLCDRLLYSPHNPEDSRVNVPTPKSYGLDYDNLFINAQDGTKIHMQFIKQPVTASNCATLIYLHGNAGNIGHRLINAIEFYKQFQCNLLMVEYRGYGLSEGQPSESGLYQDALAAIQFLNSCRQVDSSKIVLFGRSLGAAVAIGLADQINNDSRIAHLRPMAMVIENTFTSVPDISRHLFAHHTHNSPLWFTRFLQFVPDWFYKSRFNSIDKISRITVPTIFISGLSDELIPPKMMIQLFKNSPAVYKELHTFESGTHNFTWKCPTYYETIGNFLKIVHENKPMMMSSGSNINETATDTSCLDYQCIDLEEIEKMPLIASQKQDKNDDDSSHNTSNLNVI